jgi:hypothetical protein
LNICTLKLVHALGLSDDSIDPRRKIKIEAYDDEERAFKGLTMLPIQVGPIIKNIFCQFLDHDLSYNILLGHPWIHEMQEMPSMHHQCLKFPYDRQEITIPTDYNSSQICSNLWVTQDTFVPHNREALVISPSNHTNQIKDLTKNLNIKLQLKDKGVGEYSLCISNLPISRRSHGQPTLSKQKFAIASTLQSYVPITMFDGRFIKANTSVEEAEDRDILNWLYKDEDESILHIKLPT